MSMIRRLYNVAYGKVRAWQAPSTDGGLAGESIGRLREESASPLDALQETIGRLEAEAELSRGGAPRATPASDAPSEAESAPAPRAPRSRDL